MSAAPWLTDEQVKDLTGYSQPARQVRWLEANRIRHFVNGLNQVRVPSDAIATTKATTAEKRTEPDFTKVKKN